MRSLVHRLFWFVFCVPLVAGLGSALFHPARSAKAAKPAGPDIEFATAVRPLLKTYCLDCHSTKKKKGSLDLERFSSLDAVRADLKPWQQTVEMLESGEMPPKGKPQPTAGQRAQLVRWVRDFLDAEARARAGDPGHVPLRRLSNAEYDCTVRDLTGVDLRPTRQFPADGAGGEGFTNAAEALSDVSPALLTKYLNAAKEIAEHAVLLPDGFRFSAAKTRRDWTDESVAQIRAFYSAYSPDGRLPLGPYLAATVRHRTAVTAGKMTLDDVARREKINPKYLAALWRTLTDKTPAYPLDAIRARWQTATEKDVPALTGEIAAWQAALWKFTAIGSYRYGATVRQLPNNPAPVEAQPIRLTVELAPGQNEVVLSLRSRDLVGGNGPVVWHRPRFEKPGHPPLLLHDYAAFGPAHEVDVPSVFSRAAEYLSAAADALHGKASLDAIASRRKLDPDLLKRWNALVDLRPAAGLADPQKVGRSVPAVALDPLDEQDPRNAGRPAVRGWRRKGADLPVLLANASGKTEQVPGTIPPHKIAVHPTPQEFVAVAWTSPVTGIVRVSLRVAHAHPACGNGVAWWLEHRRGGRAVTLDEGVVELGGLARPASRPLEIRKGDRLVLAIDARDGNHGCDMTGIDLTVTELAKSGRTWDLAADVADTVLAGNPHADRHGNKAVWAFVKGPTRPVAKNLARSGIPPDSLLGRWRDAAGDPGRRKEAEKLARGVQALLTGARPAGEKKPDRALYDSLVSIDGALLRGLDLGRMGKRLTGRFGKASAGTFDGVNLVANAAVEVRLPAALLHDRQFVVEGRIDPHAGGRAVLFAAQAGLAAGELRWDGKIPVVAAKNGAGYDKLCRGFDEFRRTFPTFVCFPQIIPTDEVVCLKMYHREDEPLARLFLGAEEKRRLDRLWDEQQFISRQPVAEYKYLPQFIGFVTQDQPKELLTYFEGQREPFRKRAEAFQKWEESATAAQLDRLLDFASRAYRRPLAEKEKADLLALFANLRQKGVSREEAFRATLARVLVAPAFLFRIEQAPPGKDPAPVSDWELASRLSYFLWSSAPDAELRRLAAAGKLRDPKILAEQARRMLADDRARALAVEFGTQWIHVRGFDAFSEKNEKLFPTFDAPLRAAIYEESILFFHDLFRADRPVTDILDSDATFLNEALARHYGIPGVAGPQWRRVTGVRKYGRGGLLGLASVQARQSGSSRTSPVLRGNWVVETLLGEKLPRPPANVPQLPDEAADAGGLTTRQRVERHVRDASCATCHVRIDPFGFALEKYDPIGRLRDREAGNTPVDARAKLRDGTAFDGIDGLRDYLVKKKKDVIVRLFCKKLLGYALGRSATLSDQALVDEMAKNLDQSGGRVSAAVQTIIHSKPFRSIRGRDFAGHD